jgi:type II secretory pathway pseudopilin PulG
MVTRAKEHTFMHLQGQGAGQGTQSVARRVRGERGYAMAALLVSIAIMGILASVAMPVWKHAAQREKEAELIFRAGQYAHAIEKFKRKYANQYPPDVDILINQRFLRKKYKDPMTKDGEWRIVTPAELQGVAISNVPGSTTPGTINNGRTSFSGPQPGASGQPGQPGAGASPFSSQPTGSSFQPGAGQSSFGINSPGGRTVNVGPIAAVASKSTAHSIRIFKGRDRYDQWLVTIEDVMPRQLLRPQQPNQPNQPGRSNQPGSSRPGSSSPGFGQPGSSTPRR